MTDTTTAPSQALIDARAAVMLKRVALESAAVTLRRVTDEFNASNASLITMVANLKRDVSTAESDLKALAAAEYKRTGSTRPIDGVLIKIFSAPEFNEVEAQAWCRESLPGLFETVETWNREAFVQLIKASYPNIPGKLVDDPRPEISKTLKPIESDDGFEMPM